MAIAGVVMFQRSGFVCQKQCRGKRLLNMHAKAGSNERRRRGTLASHGRAGAGDPILIESSTVNINLTLRRVSDPRVGANDCTNSAPTGIDSTQPVTPFQYSC
jgi:hypothetical protein